jgi:lambda repressor-like predicted transcriptional regulator
MPLPRCHSHRAFLPVLGHSDSHFGWIDGSGHAKDAAPSISDSAPRKRRHQRRFTAAEVVEISEQYLAGQSMNDLARQYGVYRRTILHALQGAKVPVRYYGLSPDHVTEAAKLYQAGWSLARLGEKYGCSDKAVSSALREHGVEIRPRRGCG